MKEILVLGDSHSRVFNYMNYDIAKTYYQKAISNFF